MIKMIDNKIIFFNHFHNGDLHVSRGFIRLIMNKVKQLNPNAKFAYSHRNSHDVLLDIPDLEFDGQSIHGMKEAHSNLNIINNSTCINTWYGQQDYKYMNRYGLTMDCLYSALDDSCKNVWGFSLSELTTDFSTFFPYIDYTRFHVEPIKNWVVKFPQKKIFVANGHALSDQATNFEMTSIIIRLAQKHTDKVFILSNRENNAQLPSNVVYSSSIINKQSFDLNENSFLSTYCDVIIGRNSGASTFAMTQGNLFQSNKKILLFTNIVPHPTNKFWANEIFKNNINFTSEITCSNETNTETIYQIIDSKII
jgi:hypothetical protein